MKKLLLAFLMIFVFNFAYAQVDTSGLSKQQIAELTIQAEKMKGTKATAEIPKPPVETIETVSKWAEVGKSLAVGLGAGAREIGVAVNQFADTRVGRITTYIIIWKLMGKDISAVFVSLFIFFILMPTVWSTVRRLMGEVIEYENCKFLWIFDIRRKKSYKFKIENEGQGWVIFFTIVLEVILLIMGLHILPF